MNDKMNKEGSRMKAATAIFPKEKEITGLDCPFDFKFTLLIGTADIIWGMGGDGQCKMKMHGLLLKNEQNFKSAEHLTKLRALCDGTDPKFMKTDS